MKSSQSSTLLNCTHLYSNPQDPLALHRQTLKSPPLALSGWAPAGVEVGAGVEVEVQRELSVEALA